MSSTSQKLFLVFLFIFTIQTQATELPDTARSSRKSSPVSKCLVSNRKTQESKLTALKQTRDASIQTARNTRDLAMKSATSSESIMEIRQAYTDIVVAANQTYKDERKTTQSKSAQGIVSCRNSVVKIK